MKTLSTPAFAFALLCCAAAPAQTRRGPSQQPQQDVLRAVSVYEWTGDLAKPTAARIVPVSLFIDHHFEDAALYLSRPMPLALEPGNIYELDIAGVNEGTLTLAHAGHSRSGNASNSFDDGWFGYASWKPLPAPKAVALNNAPSNAHVITSGEGKPHFSKAPDTPVSASPAPKASTTPSTAPATTQASDTPPADPGRPTLHHTAPGDPQRTDTPPGASTSPTPAPAPTLGKPTADTTPAPTTTTSTPATKPAPSAPSAPSTDQSKPSDTSSTPAGDADRPTFRHQQQPTDKKKKPTNASASVTDAGGLLADDTGRPHLHHGGAVTDAGLPPLRGLPPDMHQQVAVSDAATRPEHNFTYEWPDASYRAAVMAKLEVMARAALAPATPPPPVHKAPLSARRHKQPPPAPIELLNEELHAYEISYGGVIVYVYSAHTRIDGAVHYLTLLVQPDIYNQPQILLKSLTGGTQMDQNPQMRFIDAVDADGDNRAELLFELRGETQRQFALYRIAQGTATQDFLTGTTQ